MASRTPSGRCRRQAQGCSGRVSVLRQNQVQRSPARKAEERENSAGGHGLRQVKEDPSGQFPRRIRALPINNSLLRALALLSPLVLLAGAGRLEFSSLLRVGEPIGTADQRLQASGWRPSPQRQPDDLDRQRAGNRLASLSACSGAGLGYCRYDYSQAPYSLSVITTNDWPGYDPGARVVRWSDETDGRLWGLCQPDGAGQLVPCQP